MGNVNENIRNFRKFRGMSQSQLGAAVHRSSNVISNWEKGIHSPDIETIEELCVVLNVTPNQLFGWEKNKEYVEHYKRIEAYQSKIEQLGKEITKIQCEIANLEKKKFEEEPPFLDDED